MIYSSQSTLTLTSNSVSLLQLDRFKKQGLRFGKPFFLYFKIQSHKRRVKSL